MLRRRGDVTTALTVHLSVSGTATSGDYQALTLPVVFPIGASAQTIVLRPIDDDVVEPTETVVLTLTPNAAYRIVGTGQITATITDNDVARPTVNVTATQPVASEAGAVGTFTITRTGSTASPLLVGLETGGTAKGGKDYEKIPTSVTIPAGAASVSVPVQPVNDKKKEGPETVQLKVLASAGYEIGASSAATITLTDDDTRERPTVSVQTLIPFALESGWVKSVVRFSRTGSSSEELKIKLAIDGTAKNGKDYERVANQITIPAGKLHADLEIEPLRDRKTESVETIVIGIDPHPKYVVGTNGQVQIRLFDAGALAEYLRKLAGRN